MPVIDDLSGNVSRSTIAAQSGGSVKVLVQPENGSLRDALQRGEMAFVGIGSLPPSQSVRDSGNAVPEDTQAMLLANGAVGDVCHRFFYSAGRPVLSDLDDRVHGIEPTTLRAIPRRVGIAGGLANERPSAQP